MATSPGQRFVRRHDAARSSTSNTTAADISYDTAVISEGGYSWSSPEVTVDEAGFYLALYDAGEVQLASTRAVGTLVPSINGVDDDYIKARSRYLRNSGGNHGVSNGMGLLELAVSDALKTRNPGAGSTGTDALGNYATNAGQGGGLQLIRFPDGNFTHLQRQSNQVITKTHANTTRPWLDSTFVGTQITFTNELNDDDGLFSGGGGDVILKANKKYAIVHNETLNGSSSQRQTHHVRVEIGGVNYQFSTGYERNNASDGPPMQGVRFHEVGGSDETLKLFATTEQEDAAVSNTVNCVAADLRILELPDSAEWIDVDNGTIDSMTTTLAGTSTYYDTQLSAEFRADGDSNLSLDAVNNAIQNDSGGTLPLLVVGQHMWDRDNATSGTRKHCWAYFDVGGTRIAYAIGGGFNRGQQGNDDTHRLAYVVAATVDLGDGADLKFVVRDPVNGSNSNMGIYASTNRHFLGIQALNLNTLDAGGSATLSGSGTSSAEVTSSGVGVRRKDGSGTADAEVASSGSGSVYSGLPGSGDSDIEVASSGAGDILAQLPGAGTSDIEVATSGQGAFRRDGSGDSDVEVSSSGIGDILARLDASGDSDIEVVSSGAGTVEPPGASTLSGSGNANVRVTSGDTGDVLVTLEGSGDADIEVTASGSGSFVKTASGNADAQVISSGAGDILASLPGSGNADVEVFASGQGAFRRDASGDANTNVTASGIGDVLANIDGGGSGDIEVASSGAGDILAQLPGSGSSDVEVASSGSGLIYAVLDGSGDADVEVGSSGFGVVGVPEGDGDAPVEVSCSGSGVVGSISFGEGEGQQTLMSSLMVRLKI